MGIFQILNKIHVILIPGLSVFGQIIGICQYKSQGLFRGIHRSKDHTKILDCIYRLVIAFLVNDKKIAGCYEPTMVDAKTPAGWQVTILVFVVFVGNGAITRHYTVSVIFV